MAVPLRVLKASQLEAIPKEVSEQTVIAEEQEKHKTQTESSSCNTHRTTRSKTGNTKRRLFPWK